MDEQQREDRRTYARAIQLYGNDAQWDQAVEECAELIVAIKHMRRGRATPDQVGEEVADVLIMMEQAKLMLGAPLVERLFVKKMERLKQRLDIQQRLDTKEREQKWECIYCDGTLQKDLTRGAPHNKACPLHGKAEGA